MKKYLLFIFILFLFNCVNKEKKRDLRYSKEQISSLHLDSTIVLNAQTDSVIHINLNSLLKKKSFNFGSFVKKIKILPLETTDESLLDDIYKICVTDSNIYIMDGFKGRSIVIFDKNGKFVKRISNGPGPGELVQLYDIAFDNENNELIAYRHSFLMFFTATGDYIRQLRLPFGFYNFTVIPNGYIFKTLDRQGNEHLDKLADYTLLITDKHLKIKSATMPLLPLGKVLIEYDYLLNQDNNISITQLYNDTIFQYTNEKIIARYALDYSKKKLPKRYLHCNSFSDFDEAIRSNDYYFYNGRYQETKTHNVFFLENYNIGRTVVFRDKQSGNLIGGINANYNMNEIPPIAFPTASTNESFISTYLPDESIKLLLNSSIITREDKVNLKSLTFDDNPVLVFYTLKDF